jgi:hypothetical protein
MVPTSDLDKASEKIAPPALRLFDRPLARHSVHLTLAIWPVRSVDTQSSLIQTTSAVHIFRLLLGHAHFQLLRAVSFYTVVFLCMTPYSPVSFSTVIHGLNAQISILKMEIACSAEP